LDDLCDVALYGLGPANPSWQPGKVRDELIAGQCEELLRLAGSN